MAANPKIQARLQEKLNDGLTAAIPEATARRVSGLTHFPGKATAVVGMRRAGKTTFLNQMRRERLLSSTDRERLPYINFEDERIAGVTADDLAPLVDAYFRRYPHWHRSETVTWCFDEIQVVPGWERFIRRLLDTEQVEVFVTGSSAALLSREIATALRGRAWEVIIHPFGFDEYLRHQGRPVPRQPEALGPAERSSLENGFIDYLTTGGFPEAQGLDAATRHRLLGDYVDVAMLRDVVERHAVTNITGLRWLVRHLMANPAGAFSVEKFFKTLKSQGLAISKDTVHHLVACLQDCFLVRTVWMAAASERQRMVNPRKAYPIDPGLIPVFDRSGRRNIGHALETAVLIELERRRADIKYVKTDGGFEVDFLSTLPSGESELIQVCADAGAPETAARELRALADAGTRFPQAVKRLLTLTHTNRPDEAPADVIIQPAYEWMLRLRD